MNDTQFEQTSRAHSFFSEWQDAADRAGDPGTYHFPLLRTSTRGKVLDSDGLPVGYAPESTEVRMAILEQAIARGEPLAWVGAPTSGGVLSFATAPDIDPIAPDCGVVINQSETMSVSFTHAGIFSKNEEGQGVFIIDLT